MLLRLSTILSFVILCMAPAISQQTMTGTIPHDSQERDYRIYIPADYTGAESWPLVFNLHGFSSDAVQQQFYSEMDAVADTAHFLVCYPNGIDNGWNVGWNFGSTADDVGFISDLIDTLADNYNINLGRVYSCGMSNGGFMSYRLACELNNRIAAVASVTGAFSVFQQNNCEPGRAVPVLEIHGTADDVVPYNGGPGVNIPIDDVIQFWVDQNECPTEPVVTDIPNTSVFDGSTATRFDYLMCDDNTQVSLIKIEGGGHTWPGASFVIGVTNQDFAASPTIWDFFNPYSLDVQTDTDDRLQATRIRLFPNPTQDILQFTLAEGQAFPDHYRIYTVDGQLLAEGRIIDRNPSIDISRLAGGAYYISLQGAAWRGGALFIKE